MAIGPEMIAHLLFKQLIQIGLDDPSYEIFGSLWKCALR
jgi:hypothetical protein